MWDTVESAEHSIKNIKCLIVNATIARKKRQEKKHTLLSVDEAIKEMIQVLGKILKNFQTIRINTLKDLNRSKGKQERHTREGACMEELNGNAANKYIQGLKWKFLSHAQ